MTARFRDASTLGDTPGVARLDSAARGVFNQRSERDGDLVVDAHVQVVWLDRDQEPRDFPVLCALGAAG
jgi:hypothetical protein